MDANEAFAAEVEGFRKTFKAEDGNEAPMLASGIKKIEKGHLSKKWIYIKLAAFLVLVMGLAIQKTRTKDRPAELETIYTKYFEKYRSPMTIRDRDKPKTEMSLAFDAYNSGNFKEAFRQFDLDCNYVNQEACFFAVLSAIYGEGLDYQKAKKTILDDSPYTAIVMWNEALYHLKHNDPVVAIQLFEKLSALGYYKKEESLAIIGKVKNLKNPK